MLQFCDKDQKQHTFGGKKTTLKCEQGVSTFNTCDLVFDPMLPSFEFACDFNEANIQIVSSGSNGNCSIYFYRQQMNN